jgi:nicotinamidase-related amidase
VHYTFVDGHQHDYHVRVVEDAVSGSTLTAHEAALAAMAYLQSEALVSSHEVVRAFRSYRGLARPPVVASQIVAHQGA